MASARIAFPNACRVVEVKKKKVVCITIHKKIPRSNILMDNSIFEIQIVNNRKKVPQPTKLELLPILEGPAGNKLGGKSNDDISIAQFIGDNSVEGNNVTVGR
ncbi:unnamed protein product [Clonostachys byssicola]|uniref:Uncharacterized protein n=1 Tax=Clonostachys byssicola TaxID=160290 RepID=A0A9N9U2F6_9HYPO|nr:unnamed protein product [Clonostachys byssicola]